MPEEPKVVCSCDGIEEYNNPLPGWWVTLFYGTIVFAVIYQVLFPSWFGPGVLKWSQYKRYEHEVAEAAKLAGGSGAAQGGLAAVLADPKSAEAGQAIFAANCAACHGATAEGGIGPNLKHPPYWAYGTGKAEDVAFIVTNGTNGTAGLNKESKGGMPAWKGPLGPTKIQQVVAYVYGLQHPGGH